MIATMVIGAVVIAGCAAPAPRGQAEVVQHRANIPTVYFIRAAHGVPLADNVANYLIKLFNQLDPQDLSAMRVAVNVHGGETYHGDPAGFFLPHTVLGGFLDYISDLTGGNMAVVETNVAYTGPGFTGVTYRGVYSTHRDVLQAHFPRWPVDILDGDGEETQIPVRVGRRFPDGVWVGSRLFNYDFVINLSHFTGHTMSGFGGAIKNMGLGMASIRGKNYAHTSGLHGTSFFLPAGFQTPAGRPLHTTAGFQEALSETALAVYDVLGGRILHITVLNNLARECDCAPGIWGLQSRPDIYDIGIVASWDPVALDQATMDLIWAANRTQPLRTSVTPGGLATVRASSDAVVASAQAAGVRSDGAGAAILNYFAHHRGQWKLDWGQRIGLGSTEYVLVTLNP